MLASGSTHFLRPPPPEWSPSKDDIDKDADEEDEVTDIASPILICPQCLHTFPYSQRSTSPSTLSQIRARYVPTPDESARIQILIEDVETDLMRYSDEIRYLERTVRKLTRQRDQLQQYQREQITLISPIRRLPAEILTRIFEYHCITPILIRHDDIIAPILSLSQVCSFWRGVGLSLPHLWSWLDIDLGGRGVVSRYGPIQLIQLILANSEPSPLTFYLHFGQRVEADHLLFHILLEHAHRWKSVFFESSGSEPSLSLVSDPSDHGIGLPLLKSLTLRHIQNLTRLDIFQHARALEHLSLDDVVFDFSVPFGTAAATFLPCGQLKSAIFSRQIMQQIMSVLSSSPNLQNVAIRNVFTPRDNAGLSDMQHVQLNYLTSLTISTHHSEQLFIHMSAPALTSLTIVSPLEIYHQDMQHFLFGFPQTAFLAFLRRGRGMGLSSSNEHTLLENLKFDYIKGLTDLHLLAILELTPKLKTLMIRDYAGTWPLGTPLTLPELSPGDCTITNYLIRALTIPRHAGEDLWNSILTSSPSLEASSSMSVTLRHPSNALTSANVLVPQLHTIDFVANPSSIDYGLLTDMIASRSRSHSRPHAAWQQRRDRQVVSPLRNISVRQGRIPYPVYNEPNSHFIRPIVTLEPVFLSADPDHDDDGPDYHHGDGGQDTGFGVCVDGDSSHGLGTGNAHRLAGPDLALLAEQEIAHYRAATIQAEAQGESEVGDWTSGMVQKMKDTAVKCFWWGGSMTTPGFSFFRLVSSVL